MICAQIVDFLVEHEGDIQGQHLAICNDGEIPCPTDLQVMCLSFSQDQQYSHSYFRKSGRYLAMTQS